MNNLWGLSTIFFGTICDPRPIWHLGCQTIISDCVYTSLSNLSYFSVNLIITSLLNRNSASSSQQGKFGSSSQSRNQETTIEPSPQEGFFSDKLQESQTNIFCSCVEQMQLTIRNRGRREAWWLHSRLRNMKTKEKKVLPWLATTPNFLFLLRSQCCNCNCNSDILHLTY